MPPIFMRQVRIFLSSPGDLADERIKVRELLLGLARGPFVRGRVHIDVVSWDDQHGGATMDARFPPQHSVNRSLPTPAECDLTIVLLWSRLGTPIAETKADGSQYLSGTEWEFHSAIRANKPTLVYRSVRKMLIDVDDPEFNVKRVQKQRVDDFFARFTSVDGALTRSHSTYSSTDELLDLITQDFERFLAGVLGDEPAAGARGRPGHPALSTPLPAVALRPWPSPSFPQQPYPVLGPYEHPATFAGRDAEIDDLAALVAGSPLVLCVHAASGAGKSSLLLAGLGPRLRDQGRAVSVDRAPGDARLGQRLLRDLIEPSDAVEIPDDNAAYARQFAWWVDEVRRLSGNKPVFVLDQLDDVLRRHETRDRVLARLGVLMSATAERLPGAQTYGCKWVLCYRHEFHGEVRAWLRDVLAPARALAWDGLDGLPSHDLAGSQKSHDWPLPVIGQGGPGEQGERVSAEAFQRAIEQPLRLPGNGKQRYRYAFAPGGVERLAAAFAQARQAQPHAPLVPELQVVLAFLLKQARTTSAVSAEGADTVTIHVPPAEELEHFIGQALTDHLIRALEEALPRSRQTAEGRTRWTRALMALRHLTDGEGRRGEGVPEADLTKMIGNDGAQVLARLSGPDTRIVVLADRHCALSHDKLAEAVLDVARDEARRGNPLLDIQRIVSGKTALYRSDPKDPSALLVTHSQRKLLEANTDALLVGDDQTAWWNASKEFQARAKRQWTLRLAGGVIGLLLALSMAVLGYRYSQQTREESEVNRLRADRAELVGALSTADSARLASLAAQPDVGWDRIELDDEFVDGVNPEVIAGTWLGETDFSKIIDVIERSHPLLLRSRQLFGAMSFALEEVWLRAPNGSAVRTRASALHETVRNAFIRYHKERTALFEDPPADAVVDSLNPMVALPTGRFQMGAMDIGDDERPVHAVQLSGFSMQRHEVTNAEYLRFNPNHKFPAGEERHPVTTVSWYEAVAYAAWLGGTLPTEAQWEYAARGTGGRSYPWGDDPPNDQRAIFRVEETEPVGSRPAGRTSEGLDDMAGNVWEWCRDWVGAYPDTSTVDPPGPVRSLARARVVRGGSFFDIAYLLRAAIRHWKSPDDRDISVGFRVVSSRFRS